MDLARLTDWLELVALVLVAVGLGAAAGGWLIGTAVLGVGAWLVVTGAALMAGSVGLTWHNARNERQSREVGR